MGLISDLNEPSWELARKWLPVNVCFIAMLYTSFRALGLLSMPIVTIFKNLTNIGITAGAWYLFGEKVGLLLLGSLFIIVVGAVLAGVADIQDASDAADLGEGARHDDPNPEETVLERLNGYMWMLLNCLTTATYVLYLRAAADFKEMTRQDQALYNNSMAIPLSILLSLVMGEMPGALSSEQMSWWSFWIAVAFSGSVGFFLSLASLWCVSETGATTYAMVGALNKIPLAFIGLFIFDQQVKVSTIIFMIFGLVGGVIFAYVKAIETQADRPRPARGGVAVRGGEGGAALEGAEMAGREMGGQDGAFGTNGDGTNGAPPLQHHAGGEVHPNGSFGRSSPRRSAASGGRDGLHLPNRGVHLHVDSH